MTSPEIIEAEWQVRLEMLLTAVRAMKEAGTKRPGGCNSKERVMKREGNLGRPARG